MIRTKDGELITWKEFGKRWKEGMVSLTPVQRLSNEFISTFISFIGFLVGFVALIIFMDKLIVSWFAYGLILIFAGSAYSTFIKLIGTRQQLNFFRKMENSSGSIDEVLDKIQGGIDE